MTFEGSLPFYHRLEAWPIGAGIRGSKLGDGHPKGELVLVGGHIGLRGQNVKDVLGKRRRSPVAIPSLGEDHEATQASEEHVDAIGEAHSSTELLFTDPANYSPTLRVQSDTDIRSQVAETCHNIMDTVLFAWTMPKGLPLVATKPWRTPPTVADSSLPPAILPNQ